MEKRTLYPLPKKRIKDSLARQDYSFIKPQNVDITFIPIISEYIILMAELEGEKIKVIIDYRANRSYVLIRLTQKLKRRKQDKENPYPLMIVDGTPVNHDEE